MAMKGVCRGLLLVVFLVSLMCSASFLDLLGKGKSTCGSLLPPSEFPSQDQEAP